MEKGFCFCFITDKYAGTQWILLEKKRPENSIWLNFRLIPIYINDNMRKKSFSVAWNGERYAEGKDHKIMMEHYPDLFKEVDKWIKVSYYRK